MRWCHETSVNSALAFTKAARWVTWPDGTLHPRTEDIKLNILQRILNRKNIWSSTHSSQFWAAAFWTTWTVYPIMYIMLWKCLSTWTFFFPLVTVLFERYWHGMRLWWRPANFLLARLGQQLFGPAGESWGLAANRITIIQPKGHKRHGLLFHHRCGVKKCCPWNFYVGSGTINSIKGDAKVPSGAAGAEPKAILSGYVIWGLTSMEPRTIIPVSSEFNLEEIAGHPRRCVSCDCVSHLRTNANAQECLLTILPKGSM